MRGLGVRLGTPNPWAARGTSGDAEWLSKPRDVALEALGPIERRDDERINDRTNGRTNERADERANERADEHTDERADERADERTGASRRRRRHSDRSIAYAAHIPSSVAHAELARVILHRERYLDWAEA